MPVVEVLRRDVRKPDKNKLKIMWHGECRFLTGFCPMGLHPAATELCPIGKHGFPIDGVTKDDIENFADWWDSLSLDQGRKAIDAIWTEEPNRLP